MEEYIEISLLLDSYSSLLTEKQADIMNLYYNENLSLAEISEITNTSRQAIHDILKRCNKTLVEYEKKLRLMQISKSNSNIKKYIQDSFNEIRNECKEIYIINKLDEIEEKINNEL